MAEQDSAATNADIENLQGLIDHLLGPAHRYRVNDEAKFRASFESGMGFGALVRLHRVDHRNGFQADGHEHEEPDGIGDGRAREADNG